MSTPHLSIFAKDDAWLMTHEDPDNPADVDIYWEMKESSPIQGRFEVGTSAEAALLYLQPRERARFRTLFLELEAAGQRPRAITTEMVEQAIARAPLSTIERAERLLRFLHDETVQIGQTLEFGHDDLRPLMLTESTNASEIMFLLDFLEQQGLVASDPTFGTHRISLTVPGFAHIAEQFTVSDSSQAFVAMWFHDSMNDLYGDGIAPGIMDANFEPLRVDRQPTLHRIDDQIIAEIRRSRFMVADFTNDGQSARGSVYYEAGFAHGLGIPVIFTCRQDQIEKLHFDTRQHLHIGWTEPSDLREPLRYRIEAVIGRGPATSG